MAVIDTVLNLTVILLVVAGIRTFLVSPFQVEGSSMSDTLESKEYIIINKLAYWIGAPERGDIVVFHPPVDEGRYFVKRVIGMPGDTVTLRSGDVYVLPAGAEEEIKLPEEYLTERNRSHTFPGVSPASADQGDTSYHVPEGRYFLLGDNRLGSSDSRSFRVGDSPQPFVEASHIKGKVWFVALPITKVKAFGPVEYDL